MRNAREEMFEYYKKNRNLNYYYYMDEDPIWQKDIEDLTIEFFEIINENKENKNLQQQEDKIEEQTNILLSKTNLNSQSIKPKSRKFTENFISRKTSDNYMAREKKIRSNFEKDCLDLDDLVNADLPTEYNAEKHEDLMINLGEDLMNSRKIIMSSYLREKKSEYMMKNDDFNLLLCLMRKKKEQHFEKNPYYTDYHLKLEDVYVNEKDEVVGMNMNKDIDIEGFVKKYIDNELNN